MLETILFAQAQIALTDRYDQEVLTLVNAERTSRGLAPVSLSQKLDTAADRQAQDMAVNYYKINHTGSDGSSAATRITRAGYNWTSVGENGAAGQPTATTLVSEWMNSTKHRANILNPNFTHMGLGYTYLFGTGGTANNFKHYWIQDFAVGDNNPGTYVPQTTEQINGTNTANTVNGTTSSEVINGGGGNDVINGDGGNDIIDGGIDNDTVNGGVNDDTVNGGLGNDNILGENGNDVLTGGPGLDQLTGGNGLDVFKFESWGQGLDTVTDFNVVDDTIYLSSNVFRLPVGTLNPSLLTIGTTANNTNQRIIYNPVTGALLYDADGSGSGTARVFATLSPGLTLTNRNIVVF